MGRRSRCRGGLGAFGKVRCRDLPESYGGALAAGSMSRGEAFSLPGWSRSFRESEVSGPSRKLRRGVDGGVDVPWGRRSRCRGGFVAFGKVGCRDLPESYGTVGGGVDVPGGEAFSLLGWSRSFREGEVSGPSRKLRRTVGGGVDVPWGTCLRCRGGFVAFGKVCLLSRSPAAPGPACRGPGRRTWPGASSPSSTPRRRGRSAG